MKIHIFFCILFSTYSTAAQTFSEKISREIMFEKPSTENALMIANMNGGVKITAYEGQQILVEVVKTIVAKTDARLETGKQEIQLGVIDRADTLILYVQGGCLAFGRNQSGWQSGNWSYQSNRHQDCHPPYDFRMDFVVRVPAGTNLLVSTINHGDIEVGNVTGAVKANNINGNIRLANLKNQVEAHTINGDVDVDYASNPSKGCRFYTLNGDINANFQAGLSANLTFESFNGDLYTNLDRIEALAAQIHKSERSDGLRFKISGNTFRVRNGGPLLDFETFNGNVYLKEK